MNANEIGVVLYEEWHSKTAKCRNEHKELVLALCDYLNDNHASYFARPVMPQTLKRWAGRGLCELTEASLDEAIRCKRIPPRRGRPHNKSKSWAALDTKEIAVSIEEVLSALEPVQEVDDGR